MSGVGTSPACAGLHAGWPNPAGYARRMFKRLFGGGRRAAPPRLRVLMVCMGNICRSPLAEAVLRSKLAQAGLADLVEVDSAGTSEHHRGESPDPRGVRCAEARGYSLKGLRARPVVAADFEQFDLMLAMDRSNLEGLQRRSPEHAQAKLALLLPLAGQGGPDEVPDPYYGGAAGFEHVIDLLEPACDALVRDLRVRVQQRPG